MLFFLKHGDTESTEEEVGGRKREGKGGVSGEWVGGVGYLPRSCSRVSIKSGSTEGSTLLDVGSVS
jgi:hypothetical protein